MDDFMVTSDVEHYSGEFYIDRINEAGPVGQLIEHSVKVSRRQSDGCLLPFNQQGSSDSELYGFKRVLVQRCAECERVAHVCESFASWLPGMDRIYIATPVPAFL